MVNQSQVLPCSVGFERFPRPKVKASVVMELLEDCQVARHASVCPSRLAGRLPSLLEGEVDCLGLGYLKIQWNSLFMYSIQLYIQYIHITMVFFTSDTESVALG